ncbi:MAG: hypothetical protein GY819_03335 [Planctomycetaceae bacterium]|nr:hypothetical protein [Planctomycetaceae bacterium]
MFTGTLAGEDETKLILKTAEKPRLEILKEDIDERKQSSVSVMPAGQLDQLEPQQVKDLMKYLQLPLPPK